MADDHRYRPAMTRGGAVIQSGLDAHPRSARAGQLAVEKRPFRALVVNARVVEDEGHVRGLGAECDVILVQYQIPLYAVQVMQRQHGINNIHDLWVPRPSTRVLDENAPPLNLSRVFSRRGSFVAPFTPLGDTDGDHVLVDFIEGNPDFPIIIGALPHGRSNRYPVAGDGWREGDSSTRGTPRKDEFYTHHYGAEVRINEQGDVLIDTVGAYSDPSTEDASVASGQVRIRVKDSQRLTIAIGDDEDALEVWKNGGQLRIDLGEGANQRVPLGDDQVSALKALFGDGTLTGGGFSTWAETVKAGITAAGGTIDNTALYAAITNARTALDNALSDLVKTKKS